MNSSREKEKKTLCVKYQRYKNNKKLNNSIRLNLIIVSLLSVAQNLKLYNKRKIINGKNINFNARFAHKLIVGRKLKKFVNNIIFVSNVQIKFKAVLFVEEELNNTFLSLIKTNIMMIKSRSLF